ncbi:MAG: succinylglutamate desuccinylase/aspartoacylase family protein [Fibrobacteria bacterium]|nr:succinylglutamate desuccinylase/aspartoacylase family protein [Fibrobacteria bacterium]
MKTAPKKDFLKIGNTKILPGERKRVHLDVAALFDFTELTIPVEVIRGKLRGPTMFISAAIHGDEINGVEIIKQILQKNILSKLKGTLIVVPVVNIFGFNNKSRYLPDRRDLNRCFPGHANGSLGSQLAHIFMKEIVSKCTHGIDLHTGAIHRVNLPQIRACLDDAHTDELAKCFGVPVIIDSKLRDGSLREAARKKKVTSLLFEGGQALRFEARVIKQGVRGCMAVMRKIGMLPPTKSRLHKPLTQVYVAKSSYWIRAPHSGSFRTVKIIGDQIQTGELLAIVSDPFGNHPFEVNAEVGGIVIGISAIPLVNKGDAMIHVATFSNSKRVKHAIEQNN